MPDVRIPPQDLEAEQALLGSMLLHRDGMTEAFSVLTGDDVEAFYLPQHRVLFAALSDFYDTEQPTDLVILRNFLTERRLLKKVGGVNALIELVESTPSHLHAKQYAETVRDKWFARRVISECRRVEQRAWDNGSPSELRELSAKTFNSLGMTHDERKILDCEHIVTQAYESLKSAQSGVVESGIPTLWYTLNEMVGGLRRGELTVIAGRPSMGKTTCACNMAEAALWSGVPVLMYSMESKAQEIATKMMCSKARCSTHRARSGSASETEWMNLERVVEQFKQMPLWIDDDPSPHIMDITTRSLLMHRKHGIGLIIVDYLQAVRGHRGSKREQVIAETAESLKQLARSLDVPVVVLAALNRGAEDRSDNRPRMADLRESGAVEYYADMILLLHRPEYYDRTDDSLKGKAEIIVDKQRNGPTGIVHVTWLPDIQRFEEGTADLTVAPEPQLFAPEYKTPF